MALFKRNKPKEDVIIQPPASSRVSVEVDKNASAEAHKKAVEANEHLNQLLVANGFTLKIYLAAGGQVRQKRGGKK